MKPLNISSAPIILEYDGREIKDGAGSECTHNIYICEDFFSHRDEEKKSAVYIKRPHPVVQIANDDDSFYHQTFNNWQEINEFIAKLRDAALKAWGISNIP